MAYNITSSKGLGGGKNMRNIKCSVCGIDAEVMAIYKRQVLCYNCLGKSGELAQYLLDYLARLYTPKPAPPQREPFGSVIGGPLELWDYPPPGSGGRPKLLKKAKINKVKTRVTVGSVEWIDP
jgi:hypothetical protein